jgi:hypothetical protein
MELLTPWCHSKGEFPFLTARSAAVCDVMLFTRSWTKVTKTLCRFCARLNGTAASTGSLVGDGIVSTNVAIEGLAYHFPGDGTQYMEIPLSIDPADHPQITMGAWVKPASWNQYRSGDAASFDPMRFILSSDSNEGEFNRALGIRSQNVEQVGWSAFMGEHSAQQDATVPVGELGAWSFVAVVYNQYDGTALLYVNGKTVLKAHTRLGAGRPTVRVGGNGTFEAPQRQPPTHLNLSPPPPLDSFFS